MSDYPQELRTALDAAAAQALQKWCHAQAARESIARALYHAHHPNTPERDALIDGELAMAALELAQADVAGVELPSRQEIPA